MVAFSYYSSYGGSCHTLHELKVSGNVLGSPLWQWGSRQSL